MPFLLAYNVRLRSLGGKVIIPDTLKFGSIRIGFDKVGIFDSKRSRAIWECEGTIIFKKSAFLGHGTKISVMNSGILIIGEALDISCETSIVTKKMIEIGDNCLISWDVLIMDTDFHKIFDGDGEIINSDEPIKIGNHVWIGCRNTILKGTQIGDNCIVGSNSRLSENYSANNSIIGGVPAKILRNNINWVR